MDYLELKKIRSKTSDELYHYGIKGMKWGERKALYQENECNGINRKETKKKKSKTLIVIEEKKI